MKSDLESAALFVRPAKRIADRVAREFGVTAEALQSQRRAQEVALPRKIGYWLTKRLTDYSLPQIGVVYKRDHTTVLQGVLKLERMMAESPALKAQVERLEEELRKPLIDDEDMARLQAMPFLDDLTSTAAREFKRVSEKALEIDPIGAQKAIYSALLPIAEGSRKPKAEESGQ